MNLEGVKDCWDKLARTNPVGAMLPSDVQGRINDIDELFLFGHKETDALMAYITSLNIHLGRKKALDFGCGLGRITQALADHFDEVYGIDIAPSIVEIANRYNRHLNKCKYFLNQTNDLRIIEDNSVDFIWCYGTLHLIEPQFFRDYIKEFFRILVPGGLVIFYQAAKPAKTLKGLIMYIVPTRLLNLYRRAKYGFEVHSIRQKDVVKLIAQLGGIILHTKEDRRTPGLNWVGFQYAVLKQMPPNFERI